VKKLGLEIFGLSIASFITNLFIYLSLLYMTSREEDFEEALEVEFMCKQVWDGKQLKNYLYIGLPNMLANSLEFLGFDTTSFMAARLGVNE